MRRLLVLAVMAFAPFAASAQELPAEQLAAASAPAAYHDWTGFHLGLHGGWSAAELEKHVPRGDFTNSYAARGGFAGGHAGYDRQWGWFVAGLELNAAWARIEGDDDNFAFTLDATEVEWLAGADLRVGFGFDRLLLYGTAGLAWAGLEQTNTDQGGWTEDETFSGWSAGFGADFMVTQHVAAGLAYRFFAFQEEEFVPTTTVFPFDLDGQMRQVKARMSYRF